MPKQDNNFLKGWSRQLRAALDEGGELAYECAELIDEALALLPDGEEPGSETDPPEPSLGSEGPSDGAEGSARAGGPNEGQRGMDLDAVIRGLVDRLHDLGGEQATLPLRGDVPRGTGTVTPDGQLTARPGKRAVKCRA